MVRGRFKLLLVTLLALLLCLPLLRYFGPAARVVFTLLFFGMLASAVLAVSERKKQFVIAAVAAGIVVVLRALNLAVDDESTRWLALKVAGLTTEMVFFGYTVVLVVRHVLAADRVTSDMISASLCAYLLIGVVWAQLYTLLTAMESLHLEVLEPAVFSPSLLAEETVHSADLGRIDGMYVTATYLSFVTLSTLGYGDVTPVSDLARMLTVVEAIIGQFYLTVLVARLVGLHIAGSTVTLTKSSSPER